MSAEEFVPGASEPSDAQKSAGNYRKGHKLLHGMRVSVENQAGTQRSGVAKDGKPWTSTLTYDYGYIRGSKGKDKDSIDLFIGPNHSDADAKVFVVDQNDDDGAFDEHKSLIGFDDAEHAVDAYMSNYPSGWKGMSAVTELSLPEFRKWVYKGKDQGKRLPVSQMVNFKGRAIVPNENYAGGGAVGKAAKRLAEVLREHGVEGVLPRIQEMIDRTNRTGNEHGIWGWVGNEGAANEQRGFVGAQPRLVQGNRETVNFANDRPAYMDRSDRMAFLTTHSHPGESTPVPSDDDMALYNRITGIGKDNKTLIAQQGRDRIGHSLVDIPGAPFEANPVTRPENVSSIREILREAQRKGYYDPMLKDAGIDPALDSWRVPNMANYMAGALWEPEGLARYAHDIPSVSRTAHEAAIGRGEKGTFYSPDPELMNKIIDRTWDPTRELLNDNRRRLNFAEGGAVRFPDGAMVNERGLQDHFKAGGSDDHCSCGNGTKMFAEGGSVDDDLTRPAFRTPMIARRREDRQDREGAKQVPASLVRGVLAGTLGFGGDIEGLLRTIASITNKGVDTTPALPTGDFYRDILPGKPTSKAGQAFEELGAAAGVPLSAATLGGVRLAQRGLPVAKGALSTVAERLATPAEPLVAGRRAGSPQQRQTGAIKSPGGNWMPGHLERQLEELRGYQADPVEPGGSMSVPDWMEKRVGNWARNQMGTADDPLLRLEKEGRLHIAPNELHMPEYARYAGPDEAGRYDAADPTFHQQATGRSKATPWETFTDSSVYSGTAGEMRNAYRSTPEWMSKLSDEAPVYDLNPERFRRLGFDHVRDYLNAATDAGRAAELYGRQGLGGAEGAAVQRMLDAGLDIDPAKLSRMSLPDVVGKTADWNKAMDKWAEEAAAAKDWNKGVKQVLKQYPDSDLQWAELSPEALADEGFAMGHCVGGYCPQVEGGSTRILSLRDKKGPHVTVELGEPDYTRAYTDALKQMDAEDAKAFVKLMSERPTTDNSYRTMMGILNEHRTNTGREAFQEPPWKIRQIKGKGNLAPVAEYQPAVQDLVRNMGPWAEDILDLQNTGLRRGRDVFGQTERDLLKARGQSVGDFLTKEEIEALQGYFPPAASPDSYAAGGPVLGPQTVGLGTYAPSAQGRAAPQPAAQQPQSGSPVNPYNAQASGAGMNVGQTLAGMGMYGNPELLGKVPTWNMNDPDAENQIKEFTRGANAGIDLSGAHAFLRAGPTWLHESFETNEAGGKWDPQSLSGYRDLARQMGLDTRDESRMGVQQNMDKMNEQLKNYRLITGLQPGQSGLKTYETIYNTGDDGALTPVWAREWARPEDKGFLRSESGGSLLQAFMTMLPAVGGYAGLVGQAGGAAAPYINAAGGALMGGAMGGTQGALSSLLGAGGGALGGAAGNYLGGAAGRSIGQQAGSYFGKKAAERV